MCKTDKGEKKDTLARSTLKISPVLVVLSRHLYFLLLFFILRGRQIGPLFMVTLLESRVFWSGGDTKT